MDKTTSRTFAAILTILCYGFNFVNCDVNLNHSVSFTKLHNGNQRFHLDNAKEMEGVLKSVQPGKYITLKMNSTRTVAISNMQIDLQWTMNVAIVKVDGKLIKPVLSWDRTLNIPILTITNTVIEYPKKYFQMYLKFKTKIYTWPIIKYYIYGPKGAPLNVNPDNVRVNSYSKVLQGWIDLNQISVGQKLYVPIDEVLIEIQLNPSAVGKVKVDLDDPFRDVSVNVNEKQVFPVLRWDWTRNSPILTIASEPIGKSQEYFDVDIVYWAEIYTWPILKLSIYSLNGILLDVQSNKVDSYEKVLREWIYLNQTNGGQQLYNATKQIRISIKINPSDVGNAEIVLANPYGVASVIVNDKKFYPIVQWNGTRYILRITSEMIKKYYNVFLNFMAEIYTWPISRLLIYGPNGALLNLNPENVWVNSYDKLSRRWIGQNQIKVGKNQINEIWIEIQLHPSAVGKVEIVLDDPFRIQYASVNSIQANLLREWDRQNYHQYLNIDNPKPYFEVVLQFQSELKLWPIYDIYVFDPKGKPLRNVQKNVFIITSQGSVLQTHKKGGNKLYLSSKEIRINIYSASEIGSINITLDDPFDVKLRTSSSETVPLQITKERVNNDTLYVSLVFDNREYFRQTSDLELTLNCRGTVGNNWPIKAVDIYGRMDCENPDQYHSNVTIERDKRTNMTLWANYTCPQGQHAIGNTTRECLDDGVWSGDVPLCEMIEANENIEDYIIGGATCLVVLVLAVTIICAVIIVRRSRRVALTVQDVHNTAFTAGPSVLNNVSGQGTDNSHRMDQERTIPRQMELDQLSNVHQVDQSDFYMVDNDIYGDL